MKCRECCFYKFCPAGDFCGIDDRDHKPTHTCRCDPARRAKLEAQLGESEIKECLRLMASGWREPVVPAPFLERNGWEMRDGYWRPQGSDRPYNDDDALTQTARWLLGIDKKGGE